MKIITRLRVLIGLKLSPHFFNQQEAKAKFKPIAYCVCDSPSALSKGRAFEHYGI